MIGEKKRYWELDFVRGLCVLLMIFDHAMFSFADVLPGIWEMFNVKFFGGLPDLALDYWTWNFRQVFRIFVFTAFFVLCGISCTFSRSNLKRGIKAFLVATAITYVTATIDSLMDMGLIIRFGVIHMLAVSMIIYGLIDLVGALIEKIKKNAVTLWIRRLLPGVAGLILFILYLVLWGGISFGGEYIGFYCDVKVGGENPLGSLLYVLMEVEGAEFYSSDYFPLLPYGAIVLFGSIIGWLIYHTRAKNYLARHEKKCFAPICFLGRNALWVYVLHQVAIVAVLFIIGFFVSLF